MGVEFISTKTFKVKKSKCEELNGQADKEYEDGLRAQLDRAI